ncbi:MAG: hypothetical protein ACI9L9_002708 [Marivirga sp.]|jgi:hypothetical protein
MEKILLITHASAGFITLLTGIVAMVTPKKLKIHRPLGKVFYYTMWYVVISAFILAYMKSNVFLFLVGTLTFYTNVSGYRALLHYKSKVVKISWTDWLSWIITLSLLLIVQYMIISKYGIRFDGAFIVINVFTVILLFNLIQDLKMLRKVSTKKDYLRAHIGKMGGTFIAAITAALVQNVQTDPIWIVWLMPTALVTPILIYFAASVRKGSFWRKKADRSAA